MADRFLPGQRWISESEPELGLGTVLRVNPRTVTVVFRASAETREYARDSAPLKRVRFRAGDPISAHDGAALVVESVAERNGLILYCGAGKALCETDLNDAISFNQPEERLLAGQLDPTELFDLRIAALEHQYRRRKSSVRGFAGARMELIPHQLYIADEAARRRIPRVLLADEVGLGKTIEACLILHRLILTGRVRRVLILVPDSLVHQWFVELLRRFNLWFHIFDEDRCDAIETANPETNPFLDDQLVLASISLFTEKPPRMKQALAAGWDLLVVDEAHHLGWAPEAVSPDYALVEALSRQTPGILLLTATPEQLGLASHFARLRLLDADRFYDLHEFIREAEGYRDVARLEATLMGKRSWTREDAILLARVLGEPESAARQRLEQVAAGDEPVRRELMDCLLDQHGTGRVMFRNTRATVRGFPKRTPRLIAFESTEDPRLFVSLADEFAADVSTAQAGPYEPEFRSDPRIDWLAGLMGILAPAKVLLICRSRAKVIAIEAALRQRLNLKMAMFHEGLSLLQRDRNAAWFAEEDGARLLICSEIGSEGRNFQFSHHLVLFDLPLDPELLEQRIGRLDRIGQSQEIQVYVPFVRGSPQEVLARWYHESLNAFERNLQGGRQLLEQFGSRVHDLAQDFHETQATARPELRRLIEETQAARETLTRRLEEGQDRLLEMNSYRAEPAARLVHDIRLIDQDLALDAFMISIFDHYAIHVEELGNRTYQLGSAGVFADVFPGLPTDGLTVTSDRRRALTREEFQFLTWDHPLVTGALDLLLGSPAGNCSFAKWFDPSTTGLYLEALFLLECVAPLPLHVDRFLPPTPLRVLVDHRGADVGNRISAGSLTACLKNGDPYPLLDKVEFREELMPFLLNKTSALAAEKSSPMIAQARDEMNQQLNHEILRLRELQKINRSIRQEEISIIEQEQLALGQHLAQARLRLDAIRVIQRGPS